MYHKHIYLLYIHICIATNLATIVECGSDPPQRWEDLVQWRRRERNKIADFLVNHTMDTARDWSQEFAWPFPDCHLEDCVL